MYPKMLKTSLAAMLCISLPALTSCQDDAQDMPETTAEDSSVIVKILDFNNANSETSTTVELFHFTGEFLKSRQSVTLPQSSAVSFAKGEANKLYAVSGCSIAAEPGVTTEETLALTIITSEPGAQSAPMFFTAVAELDPSAYTLDLKFQRGVARVDISNLDDDFAITGVKAEGASAVSYVFPVEGSVAGNTETTYTKTYEALQGVEKGVFTLFESLTPVDVTISGTYKGAPLELKVATPAITRGKVYTVTVNDVATAATPVISVSDWEAGDNYGLTSDASAGLTLDLTASVLPSTVSYDPATMTLEVPYDGVEGMKFAFSSDLRVEIDTIIFEGVRAEKDSLATWAFTRSKHMMSERGNEIITSYDVAVAPQKKGHPEYTIRLGLRKASLASAYNYLTIKVPAHPKQIETVSMGGHEWMVYNCTSTLLEEQIFTEDDMTVEQMVKENFATVIGNYFQYGRPQGFAPWTGNDPNINADVARDIPWATPGKMPLPDGYHVATLAEWRDIIPKGALLPNTWTSPKSGEQIRGTVVTLPGTLVTPNDNVTAQKYRMRYVQLESLTTGAKMYIPVAGIKANSNTEYPVQPGYGFDTRTSYWVANDRQTILMDYMPFFGESIMIQDSKWNYDGFMMVRGIKD